MIQPYLRILVPVIGEIDPGLRAAGAEIRHFLIPGFLAGVRKAEVAEVL